MFSHSRLPLASRLIDMNTNCRQSKNNSIQYLRDNKTMVAKWRSKLGHEYDRDDIERLDGHHFRQLTKIRRLPENRHCADCGVCGTVWASVNLGVFLCMRCGAHHRSLGTHVSLPKGCTGTYLWGPDEIERMTTIGNARAKLIYGDDDHHRPKEGASDMEWQTFLLDKYQRKKFAPQGVRVNNPREDFSIIPLRVWDPAGDRVLREKSNNSSSSAVLTGKTVAATGEQSFFAEFGLLVFDSS